MLFITDIKKRWRSLSIQRLMIFIFHLCFISISQAIEPKSEVDVLIIGGGIAGLAAANDLNQHHISNQVLEARNRLGGRIWTEKNTGTYLELGASWLHKPYKNPLYQLVRQYNIPLLQTEYGLASPYIKFDSMTIYPQDNRLMSVEKKYFLLNEVKNFNNYLTTHLASSPPFYSYQNALNDYVREYPNSNTDNYLFYFVTCLISFDNGVDLYGISAKDNQLSPERDGVKDYIFDGRVGGYSQIINILTAQVNYQLNEIVTHIQYEQKNVTVLTQTPQGPTVHHAKYVIVTLPLGVLKTGKVKFTPLLPTRKLQAIKKLGVGCYNKIYLFFDHLFWQPDIDWIELLPDKKQTRQEFYELMNYYKYDKKPILLAFVQGDYAAYLEKLNEKQIVLKIMTRLKRVYGNDLAKLVGYRITKWGNDPYAHGGYSYYPPGASDEDTSALATSINNKVFFAGEATDAADYGTVQGAYNSGIRAAHQIEEVILSSAQPLTNFNFIK